MMDLDTARALMHEWTASDALRTHMECVSACMGAYAAEVAPGDEARWRIAGLLHDFDYERHPTLEAHPARGVAWLREHTDLDEEILDAIMGHGTHTGVARTTPMARTLFAVDELAGFVVAAARVRPSGIADLEAKSVRKKLKDKAFAAAVSREDIALGIEELGVDPSAHVERCIEAIRGVPGPHHRGD